MFVGPRRIPKLRSQLLHRPVDGVVVGYAAGIGPVVIAALAHGQALFFWEQELQFG